MSVKRPPSSVSFEVDDDLVSRSVGLVRSMRQPAPNTMDGRTTHEIEITWPSGEGAEAFCFRSDLSALIEGLRQAKAGDYPYLEAAVIDDDGEKALIVNGALDGSLSFIEGSGMNEGRVSVIADRQHSSDYVEDVVSGLLGLR